MIIPNDTILPAEVIKIQLVALMNNDNEEHAGVLLLAADGNGPFPPVRLRSARQGNGATIMMETGLLVLLLRLLMISNK